MTLRIFSENLQPDIIEGILGVAATKTSPRDKASKYKSVRDHNYWARTTKEELESTNNLEHIELLLSSLKGKEAELSNLRKQGCSTDIFCFWDSDGQGGPFLDCNLMAKLVEFGLDISWDIYFDDE